MLSNDDALKSFGNSLNVAVFGASGGIGTAFIEKFIELNTIKTLHAFSRQKSRQTHSKLVWHQTTFDDSSLAIQALPFVKQNMHFDIILVAIGLLHEGDKLQPEKSWRSLDTDSLFKLFNANAIIPALIAKNFLPLLNKNSKSIFAALSARIGSITDNKSGGWHSYRASKAALNMLLKNFSLELMRTNSNALCVGLHPGTVNTNLSRPYQRNINTNNLFSPHYSVDSLLKVIDTLEIEQSGCVFAWDGQEIKP